MMSKETTTMELMIIKCNKWISQKKWFRKDSSVSKSKANRSKMTIKSLTHLKTRMVII